MKLVAGIEALNIPALFAAASRRIILHAAVYGPFGDSAPHRNGLAEALGKDSFQGLDIIGLEAGGRACWQPDFLGCLRFGHPLSEVEAEVRASQIFLENLVSDYPGKVRIHPARQLPCLPLLIIDDTIIFGQYAHAETGAPQGFWGVVEADMEKLFKWAETGSVPPCASNEEMATYRLVCECCHSMSGEENHG